MTPTTPLNRAPSKLGILSRAQATEAVRAGRVRVNGRVVTEPPGVTIRKRSKRETHLVVELRQGRNREIRKMFESIGHEVTRLKRVQFGGLEIAGLRPGAWRALTLSDVRAAFPRAPRRAARARGGWFDDMLVLDTSFLVEYEREVADRRTGPARSFLRRFPRDRPAISIITVGEFAEGFADRRQLDVFVANFAVLQVSREIAWRMATVQTALDRRLGEHDAWIAATALAYSATLVAREQAFRRVPRLKYEEF